MHYSQEEKHEIVRLVEGSQLGVKRTLSELGINRSTFYGWYARYREEGYDGLSTGKRKPEKYWNQISERDRDWVVGIALEMDGLTPRELAYHIIDHHKYYISESSVYRILKERGLVTSPAYLVMAASDSFRDKTSRPNQMWQTDFTYFKVVGWGWYYLSTVLDDYSRYIVGWELCASMKATDVKSTLDGVLLRTGVGMADRPKLLSDNGSCYLSGELESYLKKQGIKHVRGRPLHPQTQGKIERYHRSMKNIVKLEHYYDPSALERSIGEFVDYYNDCRYHESLDNLTPSDVYFGRDRKRLRERSKTKEVTMRKRKQEFVKAKSIRIWQNQLDLSR